MRDSMEDHELVMSRRFTVPPHNVVAVEIDKVGLRYYTGILDYIDGEFRHRAGSGTGHDTFLRAQEHARRLWAEERANSTPTAEETGDA